MKEKSIIYQVVILILIATDIIILYRFHFSISKRSKDDKNYSIIKDTIESEKFVSFLEGQIIPQKLFYELENLDANQKSAVRIFNSPLIICTLFSTIGCIVCLDSELRGLDSLYYWIKSNNLPASVIGIANSWNQETLLRFKRASGFTFPLFIDNQEHISKYFKIKKFPVTILIDSRSNIILKANHPIKDNMEWSKHFFSYTKSLIKSDFVK